MNKVMRIGDTIIGKTGRVYEVTDIGFEKIKAKSAQKPRRIKTFLWADLECIDRDDGLWQEYERK